MITIEQVSKSIEELEEENAKLKEENKRLEIKCDYLRRHEEKKWKRFECGLVLGMFLMILMWLFFNLGLR
jgi:predicted nuclease with TOPRIM domain